MGNACIPKRKHKLNNTEIIEEWQNGIKETLNIYDNNYKATQAEITKAFDEIMKKRIEVRLRRKNVPNEQIDKSVERTWKHINKYRHKNQHEK